MTKYDKLLEQISLLDRDIESSGINFDAIIRPPDPGQAGYMGNTFSFWPTPKDAAKRLLRMKNPDVTKEQADMIFDSEKELNDKEEAREERRRRKEEEKSLTREEKQALSTAEKEKKKKEREDRRLKRKEARKKRIQEYKKLYKEKIKELLKEAEDILKNIKNALLAMFTNFISIAQKLIISIIKTVNAIIGVAMAIVLPPFNIPAALTQLMLVLLNYLNILKDINDLKPYFKIFNLIPLVLPKSKIGILSTIFKPIVQGLRAFYIPIKLFNSLIIKFLTWIQSFLSNNKAKIFRKATRKLKKLGHLYRFWFINPQTGKLLPGKIRGDYYAVGSQEGVDYPCHAFEEDDIDEIQGLLDTFIVGFEGDKNRNRVVAYRKKISVEGVELAKAAGFDFGNELDFESFDFEKIANDLNLIPQIETSGEASTNDLDDRFVYDIELPDGTIIQNVTEEGIDFYSENYILKYVNAFTQSYQQVSNLV